MIPASRATIVLDEWPKPPVGASCTAVVWGLEASMGDLPGQPQKVVEAELWFVHKAPDGKETTQRQVIRLRGATSRSGGGLSEFYFDDMVVNATLTDRTEPVTVEVFGSLFPLPKSNENEITIALNITRRYINPKAIAAGVPPTVGKGYHLLTLTPGEVVSFVLPPLENDRGAFLGHRFSVRLRIKPLGPEGN